MSYGRMAYDRLAGINFERMREYRLQRTKEAMAKHGIDVLITWDAYSIRYITGGYATVPCRFPQAQMVVLPINGDPHCFLTTSFSCYELRKEMPWLKNKIWAPPGGLKWARNVDELETHMAKIVPIIEEHGQKNGVIGFDGCCSELMMTEALKRKGVTRFKHAEEAMFDARVIKNEDEIACMRMACNSATAAFYEIKKALVPGVRECDLVGVGI